MIRNARMWLELDQEEAGRLVGVTRRAWEHWESGTRKMPVAAFELFIAKIAGQVRSTLQRQLVVVVADDGITPIDVLSNENFLSLKLDDSSNTAVISSLGIDKGKPYKKGKPCKHETRFSIEPFNGHVVRAIQQWQQESGQSA